MVITRHPPKLFITSYNVYLRKCYKLFIYRILFKNELSQNSVLMPKTPLFCANVSKVRFRGGILTVQLGCYTDNEASIRTILANGGMQVEEKDYLDGEPMFIFEIPL